MISRSILRWPLLLCGAAFSVSLVVGCGSGGAAVPTGNVTGTVTFQGQPVTEGTVNVMSHEAGRVYVAALGTDGKFQVKEPVVVGKYAIFVAPPPGAAPTAENPIPKPVDPPNIPKKYRTDATSGLIEEVKKGGNEFKFDLKP